MIFQPYASRIHEWPTSRPHLPHIPYATDPSRKRGDCVGDVFFKGREGTLSRQGAFCPTGMGCQSNMNIRLLIVPEASRWGEKGVRVL